MGSVLGSMGMLSAAGNATGAPTTQSESVPDGKQFDNLVGAYYYGWYGPDWHGGFHWDGDLGTPDGRSHRPTLGEYSSHDQAVVDQHIAWALNHGINWFNCTWWGPDGFEENTILDYLLESQHADKMHFSALYEPKWRDWDWPDFSESGPREALQTDLQHIEETFFDDPNWLHIDGRPVVYFWINRQFTGDVTGAFREAISTLNAEPYIIGDNVTHADPFDAVANFATVGSETSDWDSYIDHSRGRREQRLKVTEYATDQDYIPSVQPGASWPDPILDHDADRFRDACQIMAEAMDDDLRAAIVCSFNEWHEGSTLEPAEEYGTSALEVVDDELQGVSTADEFLDGDYAAVRFEFSDVARPAENGDSNDIRPLAFWLDRVRLEAADGSEILSDQVESSNAAEYQTDPAIAGVSGKWLGTPLGVGSLVFERSVLEDADELVLTGRGTDDISDLEADVSVEGKDMGTYSIGSTNQDYRFQLPGEIPGGGPERGPYNGPHSVPGTLEAEDYDTGGEGVAYHDTTAGNAGEAYRDDDVDIESSTEHGHNVGWIETGEWLEYTVQVDSDDEYDIAARVASGAGGGSLSVSAEGESVSGSFDGTGGMQSWRSVDLGTLSLTAGETVVRVEATDHSWNLNYLEFTEATRPPTATIGTVDEDYENWIRLDASESSDPDGGSLSYQWDISSGEFWQSDSDTAEQPWIDVTGVDELTATLTVTDDDGETATAERSFEFGPDSGPGTERLVRAGSHGLSSNEYLESTNGDYRLYLQNDGNLVIRDWNTREALWASDTAGDGATRLTLQGDGNLVMYTDDDEAVWASDTAGSGANELILEDDGALVLYDDGTEVWAVNK